MYVEMRNDRVAFDLGICAKMSLTAERIINNNTHVSGKFNGLPLFG